jgi:HK97 gp10 family phage protein
MARDVQIEGLEETLANLRELPQRIGRTTLRKSLTKAAQPVAVLARNLAPRQSGDLASSILVTSQLTRRHRRGAKQNEVEVYIGPTSGKGVLNYASFVEFGTIDTPPQPYLRPAWDRAEPIVLKIFAEDLGPQIEAAAGRVSKKFFKIR